jgi:endonuclease YncB( thermonuclease family)
MKWWAIGILIVLLGAGILNRTNKTDITNRTYKVYRVIDGDTLVIDNNQEIRLINVDAPESGQCGFEEAKTKMEKMALNKKIKVEGKVTDGFGRLLSTVWIGEKMLNAEIVRTGWVRYDSQGTSKYIQNIDNENEKNKIGIYEKCREETNSADPKCLIKGNNREGTKDHIYVMPVVRDMKLQNC